MSGRTATDDLRLEIPAVLPDAPGAEDACVHRLSAGLLDRDGVESVHVVPPGEQQPAQLCIHYTPSVIGLQRIRELTASLGARLTDQYAHLTAETNGIDLPGRASRVEHRLRDVGGVLEAHVAPTGALHVEFDRSRTTEEELVAVLGAAGVTIRRNLTHPEGTHDEGAHPRGKGAHDEEAHPRGKGAHAFEEDEHAHSGQPGHDHAHGGIFGERSELIFAILCATTLGTGYVLSLVGAVPGAVPIGLYVAAYFFGGYYTSKEAIETVRAGRFEIDFLMLVAAAGAAVLGELAEGALLLALFSIGHGLEGYAMGRARRAIEALAELAPDVAVVRRGDHEVTVPVEDLGVGDIVVVKPNERFAADGFVVAGQSSVDQSSVTGESVPVDKAPVADVDAAARQPEAVGPDSRIFSGTLNGAGALEVRVTRRAGESTLARVVQLVTEAQTQTSPTQRFTDRFERVFVPAVLVLVGLLLFAWVVIDEPFSASLYRALAVLVAASPCALAISTPSAVLSGLARAARSGVLVKGGGPLENLGTLGAIAFDKTGTLTEGKPRLTDVVPLDGASAGSLLAVAVAVESRSDHPLAAAVVRGAQDRLDGTPVPEVADVSSITGRGVSARIDGRAVHVGKRELFAELEGRLLPDPVNRVVDELEAAGRTTMVVRDGERFLGVLGLLDTPRPVAKAVLQRLHAIGVRRTIMISGDNQRVATAVAAEVGVDEGWGDLLPEDKVDAIRRLREEEHKVAMVGDGVNDAPAMANATVGIAMGAAGSDVAMETADVALMGDDLVRLPFAVELSRRASRIIRQNLFASLGVVAILIPATVFGLFGIGAAVVVHEGSTLVVVANALRLLGLRERWTPPAGASAAARAPVAVGAG